jgi:iron-sulfur cluster repair protein YtfE (RIC family)
MLRNKNLISLSHQHQHALALCVRIERASPIPEGDLAAWLAEIEQIFQTEIGIHFAAEESVVFPAARNFRELNSLVDDLLADHAWLRDQFARTQKLSPGEVRELAQRLSGHIRKEERRLFEKMQELMSGEQLAVLGRNLEDALRDAAQTCILPTEKTRLRSAK